MDLTSFCWHWTGELTRNRLPAGGESAGAGGTTVQCSRGLCRTHVHPHDLRQLPGSLSRWCEPPHLTFPPLLCSETPSAAARRLDSNSLGSSPKPGDELLYLTTEAMHEDAAGRLAVLSSPVTALVADVPLCPPLMGKLVLAALNLWMGWRC